MPKAFTLVSLLLLMGCASSKLTVTSISAHWTMDKVYEKKVNVTNRENPNRDRYIIFSPDGNFSADGQPYGPLSGSWEILPDKTLKIKPSGNDEVGPSQWIVSFSGKTMTWKGTGNDVLERLELSWIKK